MAALESLIKGSPANQLALAQVPGSFPRLSTSHAVLGPVCHSSKAGLQALMSVLSRLANCACNAALCALCCYLRSGASLTCL